MVNWDLYSITSTKKGEREKERERESISPYQSCHCNASTKDIEGQEDVLQEESDQEADNLVGGRGGDCFGTRGEGKVSDT
jgi:hypothetical protein